MTLLRPAPHVQGTWWIRPRPPPEPLTPLHPSRSTPPPLATENAGTPYVLASSCSRSPGYLDESPTYPSGSSYGLAPSCPLLPRNPEEPPTSRHTPRRLATCHALRRSPHSRQRFLPFYGIAPSCPFASPLPRFPTSPLAVISRFAATQRSYPSAWGVGAATQMPSTPLRPRTAKALGAASAISHALALFLCVRLVVRDTLPAYPALPY